MAIPLVKVECSKNAPVELIRKLEEFLAENCPVGYAQPQLEVVPLVHLQQQGRNTYHKCSKSVYTLDLHLHTQIHTHKTHTPFVTEAVILPPLRRRRLLVPTAQAMEVDVQ